MYKCQICNAQSKPGQLLLRHAVMRVVPHFQRSEKGGLIPSEREEIAREVAVCRDCHKALTVGKTLAELVEEFSSVHPAPVIPAGIAPAPVPKVNQPIVLGGRSVARK